MTHDASDVDARASACDGIDQGREKANRETPIAKRVDANPRENPFENVDEEGRRVGWKKT